MTVHMTKSGELTPNKALHATPSLAALARRA